MPTLMKRFQIGLLAALACGLCVADELPYKEGIVTQVSSIKIKEGHFLDYWTFLSTSWRQEIEAAKKQGIVVSYAIFQASAKTPQEPDFYLTCTRAEIQELIEYPRSRRKGLLAEPFVLLVEGRFIEACQQFS